MAEDDLSRVATGRRIIIIKNGPYMVEGSIPLVRKSQVVSEHGEPLTWQKDGAFAVGAAAGTTKYRLCRCGLSSNLPFCDGNHRKKGFDGTETADTGVTGSHARKFPHGRHIIVRKDNDLCMQSGFCGLRFAGINRLVALTFNTAVRSLVIAMVERCPAGALTYRFEENGPDIEPDLPQEIALTTEITSDGPIAGPLWVTGGIPIERSDGQPFEIRNRVTLCNCGHSSNKPLCDGTHREIAQREARQRRNTGR